MNAGFVKMLSALGFAALSAFAAGCGGDDEAGTGGAALPDSADCGTVKTYAELSSAFAKCNDCHNASGPADGVPSGQYYDTYEDAAANAQDFEAVLRDGSMPPSGEPQLSEQEAVDLYTWASCGTPE